MQSETVSVICYSSLKDPTSPSGFVGYCIWFCFTVYLYVYWCLSSFVPVICYFQFCSLELYLVFLRAWCLLQVSLHYYFKVVFIVYVAYKISGVLIYHIPMKQDSTCLHPGSCYIIHFTFSNSWAPNKDSDSVLCKM